MDLYWYLPLVMVRSVSSELSTTSCRGLLVASWAAFNRGPSKPFVHDRNVRVKHLSNEGSACNWLQFEITKWEKQDEGNHYEFKFLNILPEVGFINVIWSWENFVNNRVRAAIFTRYNRFNYWYLTKYQFIIYKALKLKCKKESFYQAFLLEGVVHTIILIKHNNYQWILNEIFQNRKCKKQIP